MDAIEDYPRTLPEFEERFATEDACRRYLEAVRWPGGFVCPSCGAAAGWRSGARAVATVDPRAVAVHVDPAPTGSTQAPTSAPAPAPTSPTQPSAHAPATSPRNSWPARVVSLAPAGALTRVTAELRDGQRVDAEITSRSVAELALVPGSPVILVVKAAQVALYPRR